MTKQGPRRMAADCEWTGRLTQAREFHESARSLVTLAQSRSYNGAITLMVSASIGYADAITAKRKGVVNQQDHQAAPRLLREVLGNALPDSHEKFFRRLLGRKDEVNYGAGAPASMKPRGCLQNSMILGHRQKAFSEYIWENPSGIGIAVPEGMDEVSAA